jgi:RNA polymerase sigma-70 factor (ECF subfamily)
MRERRREGCACHGLVSFCKNSRTISPSRAFYHCNDERDGPGEHRNSGRMNLFLPLRISDEQAMWRVQTNDDAEAFGMLVGRWQTPIRNLCTRMLGDRHRGEDLAQETFARVFSRRKEYVPAGKFSAFLWRVALNLCYDELRKRHRRRETTMEGGFDGDETRMDSVDEIAPDVSLVRDETADRVRAALVQIPETYRSVLVLRHYEDLKFREIGEVLGIPEGTVKSRMAEGLTRLARLLKQESHRSAATGPVAPIPQNRKELLVL